MRGPPALGQAPGSPGVLCSLEDVSLPPSAAGSPPGPVALPPGGISRHLCLAAEPGTAPTGLGGQAALGRLHGKPTPSVTGGGAVPVRLGFCPRGLFRRRRLRLPVWVGAKLRGLDGRRWLGEAAVPPLPLATRGPGGAALTAPEPQPASCDVQGPARASTVS